MDKLKYIKIENPDGTLSDNVPIGADAANIDVADDKTLNIKLNEIDTSINNNTRLANESKNTSLSALSAVQQEQVAREAADADLTGLIRNITGATPIAVSSISSMTDTSKIYVLTTDGQWYYHNGSAWIAGGTYQSTGIDEYSIFPYYLDKSLILNPLFTYKDVTETYLDSYKINKFYYLDNDNIIHFYNGMYMTTCIDVTRITVSKLFISTWLPSEGVGNNIYGITFTDDDGYCIGSQIAKATITDFTQLIEVNIPNGATKLYIQSSLKALSRVYILEGANFKEQENILTNALSNAQYGEWIDITSVYPISSGYFYNIEQHKINVYNKGHMVIIPCHYGDTIYACTTRPLSNLPNVVYFDNTFTEISTQNVVSNRAWGNPMILDIPVNTAYAIIQNSCEVADISKFKVFIKKNKIIDTTELYKGTRKKIKINTEETEDINCFYNATYASLGPRTANNGYKAYTITDILPGDHIIINTFLPSNATIYGLIGLDNDDNVKFLDMWGENYDFTQAYDFIVPTTVTKIMVQCRKSNACFVYKTDMYSADEIVAEFKEVNTIINERTKVKEWIDITSELEITTGAFYNYNSHNYDNWSNGAHSQMVFCEPGDKFKISAVVAGSNMNLYNVFSITGNFIYGPEVGPTQTTYTNEEITIPAEANYIMFNSNANKLDNLKVEKLDYIDESLPNIIQDIKEDVEDLYEDVDDINTILEDKDFEISNLQRRCHNLEDGIDFAWKTFDKSYFAFVIDDCNSFVVPTYDLFHEEEIPLGVACIVNKLDTVYTDYEPDNTRTVKQILQGVEADGGEVLSHYSGNLADPEWAETHTSTTYITTKEGWDARTRDVKKTLEANGFTVRGIILADSSQANSNNGEKYCRKYFDYSDNVGQSSEYRLGRRKFFIGVQTLADMKAWIDTACQTPGFYPFCLHGNRQDEPLATVENLTAIIDYIKSKGSNVAEISTYTKVFDKFKTTTIEKRLSALENANS